MKRLLKIFLLFIIVLGITGCTKAETVNYNLKQDAEHFLIYRKVTIINLRSDSILMEVEGFLNIDTDKDGDLNITIRIANNQYQLHYVHVTNDAVYLVEQLDATSMNPYEWHIRIYAPYPTFSIG